MPNFNVGLLLKLRNASYLLGHPVYTCWSGHTTTDVLVSQLQLIQTYLLVDATLTDMLVEFNCNRRIRWSGATATNMPVCSKQRLKYRHCNMPASLVKLLQK